MTPGTGNGGTLHGKQFTCSPELIQAMRRLSDHREPHAAPVESEPEPDLKWMRTILAKYRSASC